MKFVKLSAIRDDLSVDLLLTIKPTNEVILIGDDEVSEFRVDRYEPGDVAGGDMVADDIMIITAAGQLYDTIGWDDDGLDALSALELAIGESYGYDDLTLEEIMEDIDMRNYKCYEELENYRYGAVIELSNKEAKIKALTLELSEKDAQIRTLEGTCGTLRRECARLRKWLARYKKK